MENWIEELRTLWALLHFIYLIIIYGNISFQASEFEGSR